MTFLCASDLLVRTIVLQTGIQSKSLQSSTSHAPGLVLAKARKQNAPESKTFARSSALSKIANFALISREKRMKAVQESKNKHLLCLCFNHVQISIVDFVGKPGEVVFTFILKPIYVPPRVGSVKNK